VNFNCTACNDCVAVCPVERDNEFNYGMGKSKAIYLPHELAFPMKYAIDDTVCTKEECGKCVEACSYNAIDLKMEKKTITKKVSSVVFATGWEPYDAKALDNLGFGQYPDVITNVMIERYAALNGPTKGKIVRPSTGASDIKNIAFVQCAGSRDENHLPYCSAVCCTASLKHVNFVREQYPDAKIFVFYIDLRVLGRNEDFLAKVQKDENVIFIKGKVAKVTQDAQTNNLVVEAEDILSGVKSCEEVEMVVLATGIVPSKVDPQINVPCDDDGFIIADAERGIFAAGCAKKPVDVSGAVKDATGAALKALQISNAG